MKRTLRHTASLGSSLLLPLLLSPFLALGTPVQRTASHVYDPGFQVRAYELTAEQEASVGKEPHSIAPFWSSWDSVPGALSSVYIDGINNRTWGPPADSAVDGNLTVKLAYGKAGVYILFAVRDDAWGNGYMGGRIDDDVVEFFSSKRSAEELYNPASPSALPCLSIEYAHQLPIEFLGLQVRFYGLEPVETIAMYWWDSLKTDLTTNGCFPGNRGEGTITYKYAITFDYLESLGYKIRIGDDYTDPRLRCEEWLIPWSQWGGPNGELMTKRVAGEKLAACFGYNDFDPGLQPDYTAIRWRAADPYRDTSVISDSTRETAWDAWGDIVFDGMLDEAVARAGVSGDKPRRNSPIVRQPYTLSASGRIELETASLPEGARILITDARGRALFAVRKGQARGNRVSWLPPSAGSYVVWVDR